MTQLNDALEGRLTAEMAAVAEHEGLPAETVREGVAGGRVVIPKNVKRRFAPMGIGEGLFTKVNANIGTSPSHHDLREELRKLKVCVDAGAHAVMDLSIGGDLREIRREILAESPVMVGAVPIYGVAVGLERAGKSIESMSSNELFDEIERQCEEGIDFITVHCGVTRKVLDELAQQPRVLGIVSRGGSLLARWMAANRAENPLFAEYDRLLAIARRYDATLSLGDGLRPGSVLDASDRAQIGELRVLGELRERAYAAGVQVMIEGPGHVPLNQIVESIATEKRLCNGAPFYVLGPLPTDTAAGYDHIAAAIGGAIAAAAGADFLCYVTAAEHLRLPTVEEVREGVVAARIAGHCADIVKLGERALARDRRMSEARAGLDWNGMFANALDGVLARHKRSESEDADRTVCTMCGDLCAIRSFEIYKQSENR
ncbi:MAG: phosphomethylpyrimidine synthase ThiC [Thermoanaerobaculaceae bacterium]|jgi:phosphomethylpyrimidine synthase